MVEYLWNLKFKAENISSETVKTLEMSGVINLFPEHMFKLLIIIIINLYES